jgi:hypothetical protein
MKNYMRYDKYLSERKVFWTEVKGRQMEHVMSRTSFYCVELIKLKCFCAVSPRNSRTVQLILSSPPIFFSIYNSMNRTLSIYFLRVNLIFMTTQFNTLHIWIPDGPSGYVLLRCSALRVLNRDVWRRVTLSSRVEEILLPKFELDLIVLVVSTRSLNEVHKTKFWCSCTSPFVYYISNISRHSEWN